MRDYFQEVDELMDEKKMKVDGKDIKFFLCGNMKLKRKVLGLRRHGHIRMRPMQNFQRGQAHCGNKFNHPPFVRTLEELCDGPNENSKIKPPLICIHMDKVVSDELHLFLRISDVLTRNVQQWDVTEVGSTKADIGQGPLMRKFVSVMKEIGISFDVWSSRKYGHDLDFASLMGPDKKSLPKFCSQTHVQFHIVMDSYRGRFWFVQHSCARLDSTVRCPRWPSSWVPEKQRYTKNARLHLAHSAHYVFCQRSP